MGNLLQKKKEEDMQNAYKRTLTSVLILGNKGRVTTSLKPGILYYLHLNKTYSLLTMKQCNTLYYYFALLDIHGKEALDDIQFYSLLSTITHFNRHEIYRIFDLFDVDSSATIEFDEFYLLIACFLAFKDREEKHFMYRHARNIFDLIDVDRSNSVSIHEFMNFGFLFGFKHQYVKQIFEEFDISGDSELDYKEFRMFTMACLDKVKDLHDERKAQRKEREEMESCAHKKEIVQALIRGGKAEFLLRLDDLKEARENREEIAIAEEEAAEDAREKIGSVKSIPSSRTET